MSESSDEDNGDGVPVTRQRTLHEPYDPTIGVGEAERHLGFMPSTSSSNSPPAEGETEGPLTPRNNAGPFVFDGAAGALVRDAETS